MGDNSCHFVATMYGSCGELSGHEFSGNAIEALEFVVSNESMIESVTGRIGV